MKALDTLSFTAQTRDRLRANVQRFQDKRQYEADLRLKVSARCAHKPPLNGYWHLTSQKKSLPNVKYT